MVSLSVQSSTQNEIGALPVAVAGANHSGAPRPSSVLNNKVIQKVSFNATSDGAAQTAELAGDVLQLFSGRFAARSATCPIQLVVTVPASFILLCRTISYSVHLQTVKLSINLN